MSNFGEALRKIRNEKSMTQDELAILLGTSKQVISRYENGQRSPKVSVVAEFAERLGVSIGYLTGDGDSEPETYPEISDLDLALYGEIRVMSEAKKREALDLFRFLRLQDEKQKQEGKT